MQLEEKIADRTVSDTANSVIRALAYSSVFSYPLRKEEILRNLPYERVSAETLNRELDQLCDENIIIHKDGMFYLSDQTDSIALRHERNLRAGKHKRLAKWISRFIGSFPFVRSVFLSGSISKNCMDKDGDIDYFIITKPGRLWICRTLLIAFKKIFLFNSYKFFCLNLFVDSEHMEFRDHNIYTAHEIKTLIPTYGRDVCASFFDSNRWTNDFLPNTIMPYCGNTPETRIRGFKQFAEWILSARIFNKLERRLMTISESYWKKKFSHVDNEVLNQINVTRASMSAHHPGNFKSQVLQRYESVLSDLESRHDIRFT